MNSNIKNLMLAVVVAFALPGAAKAQSVCEGLSTIVTAIKISSTDELEFFTLPGAMCHLEFRKEFKCIWPKPHTGRGAAYRQWYASTSVEMKKFAGQIQQCIKTKAIPDYGWRSFKKDKFEDGTVVGYYVLSKDRRTGIAVSIELGDRDEGEPAGLSLCVKRYRPMDDMSCYYH